MEPNEKSNFTEGCGRIILILLAILAVVIILFLLFLEAMNPAFH